MSAERRLVTAVSIITAAAMAAEGAKAVAQNHEPTPPPTPGITKALPQNFTTPQKALKEMGVTLTPTLSPRPTLAATPTPEAKSKEFGVQAVENPIYWEYGGKQYEWFFRNASFGIPPNNPDIQYGAIDVYIDDKKELTFQAPQTVIESVEGGPISYIAVGGNIVDTQTKKGYQLAIYAPDVEGAVNKLMLLTIRDSLNPIDYSEGAWIGTKQGLEDIALNGHSVNSFYLSTELGTNYINIKITNASDPSKNGTYRIRRDSEGDPIPPAVKQEATPTPTFTPTPTPPPTNGTPTIEPIATFDTNRDPLSRVFIQVAPSNSSR